MSRSSASPSSLPSPDPVKRYLLYSCASHGALLGMVLLMGIFLTRTPSTNYSIDLLTSMPAGSTGGPSAAAPAIVEKEAPPSVPTPVPIVHEAPKAVPHEALKILDKKKKKTPVVAKKKVTAPPKVNAKNAARALAIANQVGLGRRPSASAG